MKPTLPEDRELEDTAAQVSERYRAGAQDEPSAKLDAAIRAAARREVAKPRLRRNWHMPASIAAMLIIGVSLVLVVRDHEPPLPSLDHPAAEEAKLAPSELAIKAPPRAKADFSREERPSRERTARPDRESVVRDEAAAARDNEMSGVSAQTVAPPPVPAAPASAASESPVEHKKFAIAESDKVVAGKKVAASPDAAMASRGAVQALRKQQESVAAVPLQPDDWLRKIDHLLLDGKEADARDQFLSFHKQFPHFPVPERMKALLPPDR